MPEFAVSVAVTLSLPAVFSVTVNACWPLDRAASAGNTAAASELVNLTVPEKPVTTDPPPSSAFTVTTNDLPAVAVAAAVTDK